MIKKIKDFHFKPGYTEVELSKQLQKFTNEIESSGGHIVGAEPIEELCVHIIGRRFTVEYEQKGDEQK